MTENLDDFFTPKHRRLDRIARGANTLSWLVFTSQLLFAIAEGYEFFAFQSIPFMEVLAIAPEMVVNNFLSIISILFTGVVYAVVLKSVSLGLNMIIETDLNYREKLLGENNG